MPATQTPADCDCPVLTKIAALVSAAMPCDLGWFTLTVHAVNDLTVTVTAGKIGIMSAMGAGYEVLPGGITYLQIADHIIAVATGKRAKKFDGASAMRSVGATWTNV